MNSVQTLKANTNRKLRLLLMVAAALSAAVGMVVWVVVWTPPSTAALASLLYHRQLD
jgi:hypothetical protein